jgi:hypothetical protein
MPHLKEGTYSFAFIWSIIRAVLQACQCRKNLISIAFLRFDSCAEVEFDLATGDNNIIFKTYQKFEIAASGQAPYCHGLPQSHPQVQGIVVSQARLVKVVD